GRWRSPLTERPPSVTTRPSGRSQGRSCATSLSRPDARIRSACTWPRTGIRASAIRSTVLTRRCRRSSDSPASGCTPTDSPSRTREQGSGCSSSRPIRQISCTRWRSCAGSEGAALPLHIKMPVSAARRRLDPMAADSFVHLHVHSEYSMLDGAAKINAMTQAAADYGMPAIAVTDHGNTFAAFEFYNAARNAGIKPIIGLEAYMTPGTHRSDKTRVQWGSPDQKSDDVSGSGAYTHMTMWSQSTQGMHNLFRISSRSSMEGYYFKPRMDRELLQTYGKGIIATT